MKNFKNDEIPLAEFPENPQLIQCERIKSIKGVKSKVLDDLKEKGVLGKNKILKSNLT